MPSVFLSASKDEGDAQNPCNVCEKEHPSEGGTVHHCRACDTHQECGSARRSKSGTAQAFILAQSSLIAELLQAFSSRGINLTRIESRPIPSVPGEYRFFIEIDASSQDVRPALSDAQTLCRSFRILGIYD